MTPTPVTPTAVSPNEDASVPSCRDVLDLLALGLSACDGTHHGPDHLLDAAPATATA